MQKQIKNKVKNVKNIENVKKTNNHCSKIDDMFVKVCATVAFMLILLATIAYFESDNCIPKGTLDPDCSPKDSYCHICQ